MANTGRRCSICGRTFYSEGYSIPYTCPDCKRNKEDQEHRKKLQRRQEINEKDRFRENAQLEEFKLYQQRQIHEETMGKQELDSIKNKIYTLASNISETDYIIRLIKLLFDHHRGHDEFIFKSIIALGEPFDRIVKEVTVATIKSEIESLFANSNYSFQRKAVKYFMPTFQGFKFDVFCEKMIDKPEFHKSVMAEIEEIESEKLLYEKNKNREKTQIQHSINNFKNAIQKDISKSKSLQKDISISKKLFGVSISVLPKLNVVLVILYFAFIYSLKITFEWIHLIVLMIIGYIMTFAIISSNTRKEEYDNEIDDVVRTNKNTLQDLVNKKEEIENELTNYDSEKTDLIKSLKDYLQNK